MRAVLILVLCVSLVGCATMHMLGAENRESIKDLSKGMDQQYVVDYMGDTYIWDMGAQITNPCEIATLQGNGKTIEVYYYYTGVKPADLEVSDDELTPLVFENEKLIGWGWPFLNELIEQYNIQIDLPKKRQRRASSK